MNLESINPGASISAQNVPVNKLFQEKLNLLKMIRKSKIGGGPSKRNSFTWTRMLKIEKAADTDKGSRIAILVIIPTVSNKWQKAINVQTPP